MKKFLLVLIAVALAVVLGVWFWHAHKAAPGGSAGAGTAAANSQAPSGASQQALNQPPQPELPAPALATITAADKKSITLRAQDGSSATALIDYTTQIFKNGKLASSSALKGGEMVAIVYYPASIGLPNVAQTITLVTTQ